MNYIERTERSITKYEVTYDTEAIRTLRTEIINSCSLVVYRELESTIGPDQSDPLKIRNLHKGPKVGIREQTDGEDTPIYLFTYYEYVFPNIISSIDKLLSGDISALDEIFSPKIEENNRNINDEIRKLSSEIDKIPNTEINKKIGKLKELESLIKLSKLNENQKSTAKYYEILRDLINFKLVSSIATKDLDRVLNFFDNTISYEDISGIYQKRKTRVKKS